MLLCPSLKTLFFTELYANNNAMPFNHQLPVFPLLPPERLWLEEVYKRISGGERFFAEHIRVSLDGQIPNDFKYEGIDTRLLEYNGTRITILGLIALGKGDGLTDDINKVAMNIRKCIVENVERQDVSVDEISESTGFTTDQVSFYIELLCMTGTFMSGASMEGNTAKYKSIHVAGNKAVFDNYMSFPGVETLIFNKLQSHGPQPGPRFTEQEIYTVNQKLDIIIDLLQKNFMGNALQWYDVKNEIEEMRNNYSLPKKNWFQMLRGKLSEMVISGMISETISKELVSWGKAVFQKLIS
jgi:hypothetical protein